MLSSLALTLVLHTITTLLVYCVCFAYQKPMGTGARADVRSPISQPVSGVLYWQ